MDNNLKLNAIKEYFGFTSNADFARFLDIAPQTLSNWYARNTMDYDQVYTKCVGLSGDWLLTGEGEMMRETVQPAVLEVNYFRKSKTSRPMEKQKIPLYEFVATAGIVELISDITQTKQIPIDYIQIPNLPKCDGALPITGDSMYPLLKSGDIALYKQVHDLNNIIWGEMYLVAIRHNEDDFFFAKFLQPSEKEGWVKLVSQNQHHKDKEFPLESIKALLLIKASIRINTAV